MTKIVTFIFVLLLSLSSLTYAQQPALTANYDESKVPDYQLPDPLLMSDGKKVKSPDQWIHERRTEILGLFEKEVYGKVPSKKLDISYHPGPVDENAINGKAIRQEVRIKFTSDPDGPFMDLLIYRPASSARPYPVFLGLNKAGNQIIHRDPGISITSSWAINDEKSGIINNRATSESRGSCSYRWPVEKIIARGYALATIYYGDIDPDYDDGFQNGIHPLLYIEGQTRPGPDEWGSIAAWAWGLSRALDYFETDSVIDHEKVIVMGHSRRGKTALWAAAVDQRFAMAISNNSGCGGAALSRRRYGETVAMINQSFPHWFCENFKQYNDNEDALPVDQHMLIALIAPRPVYIASAEEDRWADPRGEFLSAFHADKVYRLLGSEGLQARKMPGVGVPVGGTIGYHIRPGEHDVTLYDWEQYLNFADKHVKIR